MIHSEIRFADKINEYIFSSNKTGIGTLGEKALHAIIKSYYNDNRESQEREVCGFVADILCEDQIIEIQTGNFDKLNKKLEKYLESYKVTVVYPVARVKNIIWVDTESGDIVSKHKSTKKGTGIEFLYEASKIRKFLNNDNLNFEILLIDIDEYKLLDGYGPDKKRRCTKLYKMPISLHSWISITNCNDLKKLLPSEITNGRFKFSDFEKMTKLKGRKARYSLNALIEYGVIKPVDKDGRAVIYELAT